MAVETVVEAEFRADGFGASPRRVEDRRLLTGGGRYTADIQLPNMLHGVFLRSPHAHADIVSLDLAAARAMPGLRAILTAADVTGLGAFPPLDDLRGRDGGAPITPPEWPLLARTRVRHVGEPVALVVAETLAEARDAAERIAVDYAPRAAVVDVARAVTPGAPVLWEAAPDNVSLDWESGDPAATEAAFAAAAHVTRLDLIDNRIIVMPSEPVAAIGAFDGDTGRYTLYAPSQGVHYMRRLLARHILDIAETALRVVTPDVGGSFGARARPGVEHALVLIAAQRLGRPVKWVADRAETSLVDAHGRDHRTEAELALDGDGRFLAVRVRTLANLGAYVSPHARIIPTQGYLTVMTGAYAIPACYVAVKAVFTNTVVTNAYRGAGRPEAIYVIERLVDAAAAERGQSPVAIRRRNLVPAKAMPYASATGTIYDSGDFAANLDAALALAGPRPSAADGRRRRGRGVALYVKTNGGTADERAALTVSPRGVATLAIGSQTNGQGHETAYAQLVAEGLAVPLERIRVVQGDSDRIEYGRGTGGSSAISVGGVAVVRAVDDLIDRARPIAAGLLEAAAADLRYAAGGYVIAGTDRRVSLAEVAKAAGAGGLVGGALYVAQGPTHANGCHVCDVEVDLDTGVVRLLGYVSVDDIGRVLNPMLAAGQVHGGLAQGIGQALFEHCVHDDESGQLLTTGPMDYCLPRADDLPNFTVRFNQIPCRYNPLGVKGVGEAGATGAPATVVGAVVDALADLGIRHIDMPLTPERVWRAIRQATA